MGFIGVLLATIFVGYVTSYPNHVPNSPDVCSKMIPGHGPRPQTTPNPYEIVLNKQSVLGGNNLRVVLKGKKGAKFRGFYIQIRDQDGSPIGLFQSPNEKESQAHTCFGNKNNAIHHTNRNDKESVTVYWKAPEAYTGKVKVVATVIQDFETYWVGLQAPELVTVSTNSSDLTFNFPEKRKTESAAESKTARILKYNPYSPFSPLSPWDSHNSSSEFLLSQSSDTSATTIHKRQLFGNFDFHGGLYATRFPGLKPQNQFTRHHHHPQIPINVDHTPPFLLQQDLPHSTGAFLNKLAPEVLPEFHLPPLPPKYAQIHNSPHSFPNSQPFHDSNTNNGFSLKNPTVPLHNQYHTPPPLSLPRDDADNQELRDNYIRQIKSKPHHHKPTTDPSYPNTGYFPKDILTKLTSYIPNTIYNAISKNPLFSVNKDESYDQVWKPIKGVQTPFKNENIPSFQSSPSVSMPKFGYLIYNPTSGNPFYVIPAENEDDFVSKYINRRNALQNDRLGSFRNRRNYEQPKFHANGN